MRVIVSFFIICQFILSAQARPNILWFVVDDMSANFSCYGEKTIKTPNVDKLAEQGIQFNHVYATSSVCSTFRTALITGMYQNAVGGHHHRSGRGKHKINLPDGVYPAPSLFKKAGYWTCMGSGLKDYDFRTQKTKKARLGKADYNFTWSKSIYDSHDWEGRKKGQPFFMQVQLHGGKLRGASMNHYSKLDQQAKSLLGNITSPDVVTLPPYYPDDDIMKKDWSTYLDSVRITDLHVGMVMDRLKKENLLENTIVIFFTDHGISHARGKQFLYDEGIHIPLTITGPGIKQAVRDDLIEHIDITATSLALAGINIPEKMQGDDILSEDYKQKQYVFAARDRCGEAADWIRSVRTKDYLYIRNYYPNRPHLMPSNYKDTKLILTRLRELEKAGKVNALCKKLLFAPTRPEEELYLYKGDKWQIKNLVKEASHSSALKFHREQLKSWEKAINDPGPETLEVYILETEDQLKSRPNPQYRKNTEQYKQWLKEGK